MEHAIELLEQTLGATATSVRGLLVRTVAQRDAARAQVAALQERLDDVQYEMMCADYTLIECQNLIRSCPSCSRVSR